MCNGKATFIGRLHVHVQVCTYVSNIHRNTVRSGLTKGECCCHLLKVVRRQASLEFPDTADDDDTITYEYVAKRLASHEVHIWHMYIPYR